MGRSPAYIFVVRHGNRLDAVDKQWHLQSSTPYDTPLTYSGWNQARVTGQRIGQILRDKELQEQDSSQAAVSAKKRPRYEVVVHSSPFLRCIQTAIGISAGLASIPEPAATKNVRACSIHSATNPQPRPTIPAHVPLGLPPNPPAECQSDDASALSDLPVDKRPVQKTVLRLDAFLGEWLTPAYYELISPPPGSSLMLASAKADLLRKEDYSRYLNLPAQQPQAQSQSQSPSPSPHLSTGQVSGQVWGQLPTVASSENGLDSVRSLAVALRRAGRSNSITSNGESRLLSGGAYVAPTPAYAISHNAEIPKGYVPHARDNCCHVDYQWDSFRGTVDWGDGGSYGEEWTAMHQRFRKGLQNLVDWYSAADHPTRMVTKERRRSSVAADECTVLDEPEVETESIVIIVSHGAGCNALIGAITHQPVLTDVGLASLTQADRKPAWGVEAGEQTAAGHGASVRDCRPESSGGGIITIHEHYDLKLLASTEHLTSTRPSRSASTSGGQNRGRLSSTLLQSSPLSGVLCNDGSTSRSSSAAANLVSMRRESGASSRAAARIGLGTTGLSGTGITVGSGVTSFLRHTSTSETGGLWSPLRTNLEGTDEDEDDDFLPNFNSFDNVTPTANAEMTAAQLAKAEPRTPTTNGNVAARDIADAERSPRTTLSTEFAPQPEAEEINRAAALPQLGLGSGGLWGSPRPPVGEMAMVGTLSQTKRRWTVNEGPGWA